MKVVPMSAQLIDFMGTDLTVVNSARVSFHKESNFDICPLTGADVLRPEDEKLINYLAKHNHWTPFGHCFAQFRVKAPIFVARQLGKHQVGLVWNEVSRRYVDEEPEFWFPKEWRGRPTNGMKQGSDGTTVIDQLGEHDIDDVVWASVSKMLELYQTMIDSGVAPEQARMVLPQNMMTEWIWSGSLAAFARICNLRLDPHAQAETREIAEPINEQMRCQFPIAWRALVKED